jgi:hypothetical protein
MRTVLTGQSETGKLRSPKQVRALPEGTGQTIRLGLALPQRYCANVGALLPIAVGDLKHESRNESKSVDIILRG